MNKKSPITSNESGEPSKGELLICQTADGCEGQEYLATGRGRKASAWGQA